MERKKRRDRILSASAGTGMRLRGLYQKKKTTLSVSNKKKKSYTELTEQPSCPSTVNIPNTLKSSLVESESSIPSVDNVAEDRYNHVNEKVNFIESQESYIAEEAEESTNPKSDWTHRMSEIHHDWASVKQNFLEAFVSSQHFVASWCADCQDPVLQHYICCSSCRKKRCEKCDQHFHKSDPFHLRTMYNEDTSRYLKPEEFISCGDVVTRDIPVPCFSASFDCKKCKCLTAYTVTAGKKRVVIITKDGRFDLHFPQFNCIECGEQQFANEADFVVSGWWPSLAKNGSYFVSTSLLEMWRHLKHQTPGTSERKFVQTLLEISKMSHRCATIDRKLFGMASRQYDHLNVLLNTEINGQKLFKCLACGKCPLAMYADGNMKLYHWMSALGVDVPSLFGDVGIVDTTKFLEFATKINSAKIPRGSTSKDSCGSTEYKAGKADSNHKKSLAETGIVFCTCRHGVLWKAVDMDKGESYSMPILAFCKRRWLEVGIGRIQKAYRRNDSIP